MSLLGVAALGAILVTTLCISAIATAVAMRRPRRALFVYVAIAGPPFLGIGLVALAASLGPRLLRSDGTLRDASLTLLVTGLLGTLAIACFGMRPRSHEAAPRAVAWPTRRLTCAAVAGVVLAAASIASLDANRLREIEARREANAARRASLVVEDATAALADAEYRRSFALLEQPAAQELLALRERPDTPWASDAARGISAPGSEEIAAFAPLLDSCSDLLAALERATTYPSARLGLDPTTAAYDTLLPDIGQSRAVARIAASAARVAAAQGDGERASAFVASIDRLADHVSQSPTIIHLLVAAALRAVATETIAAIAGSVELDAATHLDGAFDAALSERMLRAMALERSMCESVAFAFAYGGDITTIADLPRLPLPARVTYRLLLVPTEFASIDETFDAAEIASRSGTRLSTSGARPAGILAAILLPAMDRYVDAMIATRATVPLRRAAMLVRTGESDEDILARMPVDPLDPAGGRLRAEREPGAWIIYSVGANGRDDDGPGWGGDDVGLRILIEESDGGE